MSTPIAVLSIAALASAALAAPPTLYVTANIGDTASVDLSMGQAHPIGNFNCGYPNGALVLNGPDLMIAQQCGYLLHVDAPSGQLKSRVETMTQIYGMELDGQSLIAAGLQRLAHIDPATGNILDVRTVPQSAIALSLVGDTVYVATALGGVYRAPVASGPLTSMGSWGLQLCAMGAADQTMVVSSVFGGVYRIDLADGTMHALYPVPELVQAIAVDGDVAYLSAQSGTIRRIRLSNGLVLGTLQAGIPANHMTLVRNRCPADFSGDSALNVNDFIAFQSGLAAHGPAADFNRDGLFNVNDFVAFLSDYAAGCP